MYLYSTSKQQRTRNHCDTIYRDGVYIFRFSRPTRRAVDEWLLALDTAYRSHPVDRPLRMVIDYRLRGMPQLSYATQRARHWLYANPDAPQTHLVLLHKSDALATIIDGVVRLLRTPNLNIRFFHESREEDALAWLREQ